MSLKIQCQECVFTPCKVSKKCLDFRTVLSKLHADVVVKTPISCRTAPFMLKFRVTTGPSRTRDPTEFTTLSIRNTM
jgi:hypothetical protein